jgi:hypothetical protein
VQRFEICDYYIHLNILEEMYNMVLKIKKRKIEVDEGVFTLTKATI